MLVRDALGGQQPLQLLLVHEVSDDRVLQLGLPVEFHRAGDMASVVGGHILVDLDEHHIRIIEVLVGPGGVDKRVLTAHPCAPFITQIIGKRPTVTTTTPVTAPTMGNIHSTLTRA